MSSRLAVLPVSADLSSVRGEAFSITITMKWETSGESVSFSSWSFKAVLLNGTTEVPYTVTVVETGVITVTMTPSQTNSLSAGTYNWWLSATLPTGFERTLVRGSHSLS